MSGVARNDSTSVPLRRVCRHNGATCGFLVGMTDSPFMTTEEVAAYLRVDVQTVRRWCSTGVIPALRVGKLYRVRKDSLTGLTTQVQAGL